MRTAPSLGLDWPLVRPRSRVIVDNDFSGDPDDLVQMAHHLLSPSVEIRAIIASHLAAGDPWDNSTQQATNAFNKAAELLDVMDMSDCCPLIEGSQVGLSSSHAPIINAASNAIVVEAMRDDTTLPLFFCAGAGLTELASAWLMEPRIGKRLTLIWIGGPEYSDLAVPPPGVDPVEYNLGIDIRAAQIIFNQSDIGIWQIPRNVYRQCLMSYAELLTEVRPHGVLGRYLVDNIERVMRWTAEAGFGIGETYAMGDSPLVSLTALQSSFQPDPSSSHYVTRTAPFIDDKGQYDGLSATGRSIRVYTQVDTRLMFEDFYSKLRLRLMQTSDVSQPA